MDQRRLLPSSLSHWSCCHCLPTSAALTLHRLISLSLSHSLALSPSPSCCPSLPRFLVFHSTADLGDKFLCLPLTQRKGLRLDLPAPASICIQASGNSLFSSRSWVAIRHLMPVMYVCMQCVCVRGGGCCVYRLGESGKVGVRVGISWGEKGASQSDQATQGDRWPVALVLFPLWFSDSPCRLSVRPNSTQSLFKRWLRASARRGGG